MPLSPEAIAVWRAENAERKAALGLGPPVQSVWEFRLPGFEGVPFRVRRLVPSAGRKHPCAVALARSAAG